MLNKAIKMSATLVLVICLWPTLAFTKEHQKPLDITILVSSCDRYAPLWEPFFSSLWTQWPSLQTNNSKVPILLIANTQEYHHPRVKTIKITTETSWTDNMLTALQQVKTKYVLVLLDDYWLDQPVDEKRLRQLLILLREGNTAFIQTSFNDMRFQNGLPHEKISGVIYRNKFSHYKVSLQAGLWDKASLQYLLRSGENPWAFEIAGSIRAHGYPKAFLSLTDNPIHYINASHLGHITPEAIAYAKAQNMHFEPKQFPLLGQFNWHITKRVWSERWHKLIGFIKDPGLFYKLDASY